MLLKERQSQHPKELKIEAHKLKLQLMKKVSMTMFKGKLKMARTKITEKKKKKEIN